MSVPPGATPGSNRGRGRDKDGRGKAIPVVTMFIPNWKARHRSTGQGTVWRYELHYWQNRYYVVARPRIRVILKALGLRK
jgi:hypothetical protein